MGMDVFGRQPKSEAGEYFRNNVWWWRPLANMILDLCPEESESCTHWLSNDGDGLDNDEAIILADTLESFVNDGTVDRWLSDRQKTIDESPRHTCELCNGSGIRTDGIGIDSGQPTVIIENPNHPRFGQTGTCNGCDGIGTKPDFETYYQADIDNVKRFIEFCRDSGGFEIC